MNLADVGIGLGRAVSGGYKAYTDDKQRQFEQQKEAAQQALEEKRLEVEQTLEKLRAGREDARYEQNRRDDAAQQVAGTLDPWSEVDDKTATALQGTPYEGRISSRKTLPSTSGDPFHPDEATSDAGGQPYRVWTPTAKENQDLAKKRSEQEFISGLPDHARKAATARSYGVALDPQDFETDDEKAADQKKKDLHDLGVFDAKEQITAKYRPPPAQTGGDVDAGAIADAIMSGDQPPETTGLYRYGAAVRSQLAKKGYNLANAQLDYRATQAHLRTMNGAQQTRIQQAVETASSSLDVIDQLAQQWKGRKFPPLNRANLALAKNGAYGQQAASVANELDAQISDVTSELGNVYMGGNSPTDHALQLAGKNLSADWSEGTLRDMVKLARTNLQIRSNSIRNTAAVTTSNRGGSLGDGSDSDLPVTPNAAAPGARGGRSSGAGPANGSTGGHQVGDVVVVKGKRVRITKILPNGQAQGDPVD